MTNLNLWRFSGMFIIFILGFPIHYLYTWTGSSRIIGLFAPVNESVWEHLKLGYWSLVLFSIPEYFQIKKTVNNYNSSKLIGVMALELNVIIVYYSYTLILGKNYFFLDIFSYISGVVICQILTYSIMRLKPFSKLWERISLALFIGIAVLFGLTTFYPPHMAIYKDNTSYSYGIEKVK